MRASFLIALLAGWVWIPGGTWVAGGTRALGAESADSAEPTAFSERVAPFLATHCIGCHGSDAPEAELDLERFRDTAEIEQQFELWERVLRMIEHREMPPDGEPKPSEEELLEAGAAIRAEMDAFDCSGEQRPGRVMIRRLNRVEYNNTIRDLVGVDFRPADDFPSDDVGHGFDNIAAVLSISPILLEKYLAAAESVVEQVFDDQQLRGRIEVHSAQRGEGWRDRLRQDVSSFARRAFRRPATGAELDRLMALVLPEPAEGDGDREAQRRENEPLRMACVAILTSPHFLFRIEQDPQVEAAGELAIRELNDHEIAVRLSYFLWSSMPDEWLFGLADEGRLRDRNVLRGEVERMLRDPKARALVDNFGGQWLQLRDLAVLSPDPDRFPAFDDELRQAMREETERFMEAVIQEDRSVLDFLHADFSFVNERLAKHYGIDGVRGDSFQQVKLPPQRRGVLTQASILLLTSNPTRTSPVKRGKWILDNILGTPPPPPPAGVEELNEDDETLGSLRERMEQHRANPACAVCHRQMDALGFGLENFDAIGAWRDRDGRSQIDPSGALPGEQRFAGPAELMQLLADQRRDEFCRCLAEKLLTYAVGRGLGPYDRCAVNSILDQLQANDFRFGALVQAIVTSDPFLYRELAGAE